MLCSSLICCIAKQQNVLIATEVLIRMAHEQLHSFTYTYLHLVRCHSTRCGGRLANSQIQHKNDESQHKLGEISDLQQQQQQQQQQSLLMFLISTEMFLCIISQQKSANITLKINTKAQLLMTSHATYLCNIKVFF